MSYEAEQQNRKNRAMYESMRIVKLDKSNQTAVIENSTHDSYYTVTVNSCTCPDFQKRGKPCKHIYILRSTLGLPTEVTSGTEDTTKEKPPKTKAMLLDKPGVSFVIFGIIILVFALSLLASSVIGSIIIALIGIYLIYGYIDFKRHPDNPKYITEEQIIRWGQLVSSDKKTVHELQKVSLPILLELKKRAENYYSQLSFTTNRTDIQKCSELLLDTQQRIVELSEFVTIEGDEPLKDYEKYLTRVNEIN